LQRGRRPHMTQTQKCVNALRSSKFWGMADKIYS
jgi:hypothetical protein